MDHRLIKEINCIFHDAEAGEYDSKHCEIMEGDQAWWHELGAKYFGDTERNGGAGIAVLDVGSGTGFVGGILSRYLKSGDQLINYEYSLNMLYRSREKITSASRTCRVCFMNGDAEKIPLKDESIDVVTINAVLHHLPGYEKCLAEIDRVLKKGGIITVAHEQNRAFFRSRIFTILAMVYKRLGGGMHISDSVHKKVNDGLKKKGLINADLSKEQVMKMVDVHSPIEQSAFGIDTQKGFLPDDLIRSSFAGYRTLVLKKYSTFFYRPALKNNVIMRSLLKMFNVLILRDNGPLFSFIVRKQ